MAWMIIWYSRASRHGRLLSGSAGIPKRFHSAVSHRYFCKVGGPGDPILSAADKLSTKAAVCQRIELVDLVDPSIHGFEHVLWQPADVAVSRGVRAQCPLSSVCLVQIPCDDAGRDQGTPIARIVR